MSTLKALSTNSIFTRLFSDQGLTRKAYLNALASGLEYGAQLLLSFFITPLLVAGLGDYSYGLWQVINRMVGFLSPASGKPTQALRWTLAKEQTSADYERKRSYVGSTFIVWALFLPVIGVAGGLLAWFAPQLLKVPFPQAWALRIAAGVLLGGLATMNLAAIPRSVLQGENQSYRRMGLSVLMVLASGGLTWVALYLKTGLVGVAVAAVLSNVLNAVIWFRVVRAYIAWYGIVWPPFQRTRQFLRLSGWFLTWDLIQTLMTASDVVVLGVSKSVEAVTPYTLTKYAPEVVISIIGIMVTGIVPGLGGILGSGDLHRTARLRSELMALTWLVLTSLGATILLWNHAFLNLWVDNSKYAGALPNLLIVLVVGQFILIRNDASIIDLTLRLRNKVLLGGLSLAISTVLGALLVGYFNMGIMGLCLGTMCGRLLLTVGYPLIVSKFLGISGPSQLKSMIRPLAVTVLVFGSAVMVDLVLPTTSWTGGQTWTAFFASAGVSAIILAAISFFGGLTVTQRASLIRRARMMLYEGNSNTLPLPK